MRIGAGFRSRLARCGVVSAVLALALLERLAPSLAADVSLVDPVLDSAVRIEVSLHWPDRFPDSEFSGSGWTRDCQRTGTSFDLVLATAGHVVDVSALEDEARPRPHPRATVKVVAIYRDGRQYTAGRDDLRIDRVHDYGEVHVLSPVERVVLPTGEAAEVHPGTTVFTIASPGLLAYAYFDGTVSALDARLIANAPDGAWLSSVPVAPGASGAPVVTLDGRVVAFVDGLVEWPWGASASIIVALPPSSMTLTPAYYDAREGKHMGLIDTLTPFVKVTGAATLSLVLVYAVKSMLRGRPMFTADALHIVMVIAEKVVMAVEQAHGNLAGMDKKQLATDVISEILSRLHIQAPQALVDAAIEAAVLALGRVSGKAA